MENAEKDSSRNRWMESAPAILGASTSLLYIPGFVVVNAYMATKGVTEQPLVSSRYVAAGALFLAACLLFYFLVLKHVVRRAQTGFTMSSDWPGWFQAFMHQYFLIEALFRAAYFSAWLIAITTPSVSALAALALTGLAALGDAWIFTRAAWGPMKRFVSSGVLLIAVLLAFGVMGVFDPTMAAVFGVALLFLVAAVTALTSDGWKSGEDRSWGLVFLGIYGLLAAVGFGATVYGGIAAKYGGGAPAKVEVVLTASADEGVRNAIASGKQGVFLLASTEDEYVFELREDAQRKSTFRLAREQVAALRHDSASTANDYVRLVEEFRKLLVPPTPQSAK